LVGGGIDYTLAAVQQYASVEVGFSTYGTGEI
jgi:hypothetical protein